MVHLLKAFGEMTNCTDLENIKCKIIKFIKEILSKASKVGKENYILIIMQYTKACFKMINFMDKEF